MLAYQKQQTSTMTYREECSNQYSAGDGKTLQVDLTETNVTITIYENHPDKTIVYTKQFCSNPTNGEKQNPFGTTDEEFFEQICDMVDSNAFTVKCGREVGMATLYVGDYCIFIPMQETSDVIKSYFPIKTCDKQTFEFDNSVTLKIALRDCDVEVKVSAIRAGCVIDGVEHFDSAEIHGVNLPNKFKGGDEMFYDAIYCAAKMEISKVSCKYANYGTIDFTFKTGCVNLFVRYFDGNALTEFDIDIPCVANALPKIQQTPIPPFPTLAQSENSFRLNLSNTEKIEVNFSEFKKTQIVCICATKGHFRYRMNFIENFVDELKKCRDFVFAKIPNDLNAKNFFGILSKTANLMVSTKPANSTSNACGNFELRRTNGVGHLHVLHRNGLEFVFDLELACESEEEEECKPPTQITTAHKSHPVTDKIYKRPLYCKSSVLLSNPPTNVYVYFDILESLLNELFPQFNYKNKIHLMSSIEAKTAFKQFATINENYTTQTLFDIFKKDGASGFSFMSFSPMDTQKARCVMTNIRIGLKRAIVKDIK